MYADPLFCFTTLATKKCHICLAGPPYKSKRDSKKGFYISTLSGMKVKAEKKDKISTG
jgi:hypothetical protein